MQACVRLLLYGYMFVLPFACVSTCLRKCAKKLVCQCFFCPICLFACVPVRLFDGNAFKKINEPFSLRSAWVLEVLIYLYTRVLFAIVFRVAVCACVPTCLLTRMFIPYARMHVTVCNFCCVSAHRLGRLCVCILVWLSFSRQCVCMLRWLCGWMRVCSCVRSSACCFVWL